MNGSIHYFQVFVALDGLRREDKCFDSFQINPVNFLSDYLNQLLVTFKFDVVHVFNVHHFADYIFIVRGYHLCTIVPVGFVAVVFLRIVGSGKNNAALAAEMTDSKRNFGSRAQVFEKIHLDAVGREDVGRNFSKFPTVVTAVVTDDHTDLRQRGKLSFQVVAQALSSSTHGVNVHPVSAGTHDATQTSGTKFQIFVKCFNQQRFIRSIKHLAYFCLCFGIIITVQPHLCPGSYFF